MFHPRAIEAANNLIKLWHMKAAQLQEDEFFESSDDLMVGRTDAVMVRVCSLCPPTVFRHGEHGKISRTPVVAHRFDLPGLISGCHQ